MTTLTCGVRMSVQPPRVFTYVDASSYVSSTTGCPDPDSRRALTRCRLQTQDECVRSRDQQGGAARDKQRQRPVAKPLQTGIAVEKITK